jgi:hypothetical protein
MVSSTKHLVGNFCSWCDITNNDLLAFNHHHAAYSTCVMSSTGTTPAKGFYLQGVYTVG